LFSGFLATEDHEKAAFFGTFRRFNKLPKNDHQSIFNIRAFSNILSPFGLEDRGSGSFGFWLRFRSVTGRCGHAPSLSLAKTPKFLAAGQLQYFFKRSKVCRVTVIVREALEPCQ